MKQSAAQRAAEMLIRNRLNAGEDVAIALLREDRERRQMERAILAWWDADNAPARQAALVLQSKIARRLAKRKEGK